MRITLSSSHIAHYKEHCQVEFEELLTDDVADQAARIIKEEYLDFSEGHDLFRKNKFFQKIAHKKALAGIGAELTGKRPVRLLFDQVISSAHDSCMPFYQLVKMRKIASFQGTNFGLLFRLTDGEEGTPEKKGNGVYIAPYQEVEFSELIEEPDQLYYLVVYGEIDTRYIYNETDPFTNQFKKDGYAFGDVLKDRTHPIILSR